MGSPEEVEKASAQSSTSKRTCSAREVTNDNIFQADENYNNVLLFPKEASNTNLSSIGVNATTDPLVIKVSCVGNLVGAEYLPYHHKRIVLNPFLGGAKVFFLK